VISIYFYILFLLNFEFQEDAWELFYSDEVISIEFLKKNCYDKIINENFNYTFFKIKNKSQNNVLVSFFLSDDSIKIEENFRRVILNPYSSKQSNCGDNFWRLSFLSENEMKEIPIKSLSIEEFN